MLFRTEHLSSDSTAGFSSDYEPVLSPNREIIDDRC